MGQQDTRVPPAAMPNGEPPAARPRRRIPTFVSLVAAAAVIALSIGVFNVFAGHGGHNTGPGGKNTATTHPTCSPSQATANLPAHTILTAIAPVGTDDGWAVGGVSSDPKQPTSPPSTLILRLQNCHWTPFGTPVSKGMLNDISMVSADEGWAVGKMMTLNTTPLSNGQPANVWEVSRPLVLHYTHGSWQQVNVAADTKSSAVKVKMVSADEGWMLLYGGKHPVSTDPSQSVGYANSLLHYQNGTWDNVPLTFKKPQMDVSDLDARQPGDVWLVGFDNSSAGSQALAAHYSGGVWTPYTGATLGDFASKTDFSTVSELSPNDVWAAGWGGLFHFDGTHWTKASIQGTAAVTGDNSTGKITMASSTEGWAFPSFGSMLLQNPNVTQEDALHYKNGVWAWTNLQIQGVKLPILIADFAQSSPSQGWAISLQIVRSDNSATTGDNALLYYDGGNWGVVRQHP